MPPRKPAKTGVVQPKVRLRRSTTTGKPRAESKPSATRSLDEESLPEYLAHYLELEEASKELAKRVDTMKKNLKDYIDAEGVADEKGNLWIEVEGVGTMKHERRSSESLNEEAALAWLDSVGRRAEAVEIVTIEQFDQSAFYAIAAEERLKPSVLSKMQTVRETFAFRVVGKK